MKYVQNIKQMNSIINKSLSSGNMPQSIAFPKEITVTTTHRCNYRCVMCYQGDYDGEIDRSIYDKIEPLLPFVERFQIFGGEPMLYPHIRDLYAMAHKYQAQIAMISNGSLLTDAMCRDLVEKQVGHIKFSMDAGTKDTYKKIRGGNFFKVVEGIARISKYKSMCNSPNPEMQFNFLAMRSNISELPRLIAIAREVGVNQINVFYPGLSKKELVDECVWFCQKESDMWLSESKKLAQSMGITLRLPPLFSEIQDTNAPDTRPKCIDPWIRLLVDVDGSATFCCGGPTKIGNLFEQSFEDIWNGEFAQHLRSTINTPDEPGYCKNCRVRKPDPLDLKLHITTPELRHYALEKFNLPPEEIHILNVAKTQDQVTV